MTHRVTLSRRSRFAGLLSAVVVLAVAAGCATVPTAGPVVEETLGPAQRDGRTDIAVTDVAPKKGDTPVQTVRGFIEAMSSYQPQYPMARQFLTAQAEAKWSPGRRILVYEGSPIPSEHDDVVLLAGNEVGEIGDDGAWRAAPRGKRLTQRITLKQVDGEWRIDQFPDQVLMTGSNFEDEFQSFNLYFFDPSFEILVPDPVFLPLRSNRETALANALVRGPTQWLAQVVRSAVPPGSGLSVRSVQVSDKTALVDLTESSRRLTTDQHQRLAAQLIWTLRQAGVERVSLSVDKVPLEAIGDESQRVQWERYDPAVKAATRAAYAINTGGIYMVGTKDLKKSTALDYTPRTFAMAIHSRSRADPGQSKSENPADQLTVVGKDNRSLFVYTSPRTNYRLLPKYPFRNIVALSSDRTGRLWVVDNDAGAAARILAIDERRTLSEVDVKELKDAEVVDLKVSRDGTRIALLVEETEGKTTRTRLLIGLIERGEQLRIRGLRELDTGYAKLADLSWSGTTELVALVRSTNEETNQVLRIMVDGSQTSLVNDAPQAPAAVAAAPGRPLIVVDEAKELSVQDERAPWRQLGQAIQPMYAG